MKQKRPGPRRLIFGVDRLTETEAERAEAWQRRPSAAQQQGESAVQQIDAALADIAARRSKP